MGSFTEHVKTLVKLDAFAFGIMHVSNRYISSVSSGKNMLRPGGGKHFQWKYGDVFYHKYGEGKPLVLLHDLHPAFSSYEWNEVIDDLSKDYTVYTVDLPGCGRSSKSRISYANYYYVLFLTAFIREVVKKPCTVVASGYSSSFAIMTASVEENLIRKIVAVNPKSIHHLNSSPTPRSRAASVLISLPVIGTTVYNIAQSRNNIDLAFTEKYLYNPFHSKARFVDAFYEGAHFHDGDGKYLLASIQGRMMSVNIADALKKVGEKVSVIYGEKTESGASIGAQYRKQNSTIRVRSISGTKILPHMENPAEFAAVLNDLMES